MLRIFPPPSTTNGVNYAWEQLTLGLNCAYPHREIVENFWPLLVQQLNKIRDIEIQGPQEEAWFHLRRTLHPNCDSQIRPYALLRIEILRIKRGFISKEMLEEIRLLPEKYPDVVCSGWWPVNFGGRHDNAFLSFVQKLSILRAKDRIVHKHFLGRVTHEDYSKCPYCQEAYHVMTAPNTLWSAPLHPWFEHMKLMNMSEDRTHEYAHWFGHILSGWP